MLLKSLATKEDELIDNLLEILLLILLSTHEETEYFFHKK